MLLKRRNDRHKEHVKKDKKLKKERQKSGGSQETISKITLEFQQATVALETADKDLDEYMLRFDEEKIHRIREIMQEYIVAQMQFFARGLEVWTLRFGVIVGYCCSRHLNRALRYFASIHRACIPCVPSIVIQTAFRLRVQHAYYYP
jgi:uncharacterized protein FAM92